MNNPYQTRLPADEHPLWMFEQNYLLLRKLMPQMQPGTHMLAHGGAGHALQAEVVQSGPYTTELMFTTAFQVDGKILPPLQLQVRIYHDARLAEVVGYQGCRYIPPAYAVPLGGCFQRDERRQLNRLLHEILWRCLRGRASARLTRLDAA